MKTIVVNNSGFDLGGSMTLGRELSKLGLPVLFRKYCKHKEKTVDEMAKEFGVTVYKDLKELKQILFKEQPDRIIFNIPTYKEVNDKIYLPIHAIKSFTNAEMILLHCNRTDSLAKKEVEYFKNSVVCPYDKVYCLDQICVDLYKQVCDNVEILDFNVFSFDENVSIKPFNSRNKTLFTTGRIEAVKGVVRYLENVQSILPELTDYFVLHEGLDVQTSKTSGKLNGNMYVINMLTDGLKTKNLNPFNYIHKDYLSKPLKGKMNYYPVYDYATAKERWKSNLALVYCVLGDYKSKPLNAKTREKQRDYWNLAKEYAMLETVNEGTPVFFSKDYAELHNISIPELIYQNFEDIPSKLKGLTQENYERITSTLIQQLKGNQELVNKKALSILKGD